MTKDIEAFMQSEREAILLGCLADVAPDDWNEENSKGFREAQIKFADWLTAHDTRLLATQQRENVERLEKLVKPWVKGNPQKQVEVLAYNIGVLEALATLSNEGKE